MQIGQISELSGYSQRMIRYLEDQGIIIPERSDSNLRKFKDSDLTRILKVKKLKDLGFTYIEIKELIDKDESTLVSKGTDLLKRHHAEAAELFEKIRQLETLCYGSAKTKGMPDRIITVSHPKRVAYKIQKLDQVCESIRKRFPDLKSDLIFWKFRSFVAESESDENIDIYEMFNGSSQIAVLKDKNFFLSYTIAWNEASLPLNSQEIGKFKFNELREFFGNYEIVIEHRITNVDGVMIFHALLPYQAIFIASGQVNLAPEERR